ncbi:unnamed protein product, partial [Mesorhabditis spiculigera]
MLHHWYPQPNFTAAELVFEKEHRFLQPVWDYIKDGNEHILSPPLFPPFYALSIDYAFVAVFTFIDLVLCDVPFFKNHKIQKDRKVTWDLIKKSLFLQMWNQLLWIYPLALVQLIWHLHPFELFFVGTFITGYHITYEDLKKMAEEKSKRFGLYNKEEEKGLEKIN